MPPPPPQTPAAHSLAAHPLVERIWAAAASDFIAPEALVTTLADVRFVLLGELHDNPRHHALQAWVIRALGERNQRRAVVVEMIAADQAPALELFYAMPEPRAAALETFLKWDQSGWPAFSAYAGIFDAALGAGFPLRPGNLDRSLLGSLHRQGFAALPPATRARLELPTAIPAPLANALETAIAAAHCQELAGTNLTPFAEIQYARDATMAKALIDDAQADGAILIAGAEHVRRDRGVPYHLRRFKAAGKIVSVAFVEAVPGQTDPTAYAAVAAADYVWFTAGPARQSRCGTA